MDSLLEMKAGPSGALELAPQRASKSTNTRRRFLAALVAALLFSICLFFLKWYPSTGSLWFMESDNGEPHARPTSPDGDKYLLGVGKADITGYDLFNPNIPDVS